MTGEVDTACQETILNRKIRAALAITQLVKKEHLLVWSQYDQLAPELHCRTESRRDTLSSQQIQRPCDLSKHPARQKPCSELGMFLHWQQAYEADGKGQRQSDGQQPNKAGFTNQTIQTHLSFLTFCMQILLLKGSDFLLQ